jgi:hypothetical protein
MINLRGIYSIAIEFEIGKGFYKELDLVNYVKMGNMYDTTVFEVIPERDYDHENRNFISGEDVEKEIVLCMNKYYKIYVTYYNDSNDSSRCKVIDDYINQRFAE